MGAGIQPVIVNVRLHNYTLRDFLLSPLSNETSLWSQSRAVPLIGSDRLGSISKVANQASCSLLPHRMSYCARRMSIL